MTDLTLTDDALTLEIAQRRARIAQDFDAAVARVREWDLTGCTCYLGHPDDPDADREACAACDRAYWTDPVFIDLGGDRP